VEDRELEALVFEEPRLGVDVELEAVRGRGGVPPPAVTTASATVPTTTIPVAPTDATTTIPPSPSASAMSWARR